MWHALDVVIDLAPRGVGSIILHYELVDALEAIGGEPRPVDLAPDYVLRTVAPVSSNRPASASREGSDPNT